MTHLPFVAGSYALGILIPAGFALAAFLRLGAARRRLAAIDHRRGRPGASRGGRSGTGPRDCSEKGPYGAAGTGAGAGTGQAVERGAAP